MQIIQLSHLGTIQAKHEAIYLYPTDSLYGLGAIATMENTARINDIKKRLANKHFSLIAPSFSWILEHFIVEKDIAHKRSERSQQYGPITVLCKRKNPEFLSWVSSNEYIGIRFLGDHPMQSFVTQLGEAFLSTSANISGIEYSSDVLPSPFENLVDYYIENNSSMTGKGSTLIQYDSQKIIIRS